MDGRPVAIRILLLASLAASQEGCYASSSPASVGSFQVGALSQSEVSSPSSAAVLPREAPPHNGVVVAPVTAVLPSSPLSSGGSAVSEHGAEGQLTLDLAQALAPWTAASGFHVLAALPSLHHVVATLTTAGRAPQHQILRRQDIDLGQRTVVFRGIPLGPATVVISAYDADGGGIGAATITTTITHPDHHGVEVVSLLEALPPSPSPTPSAPASSLPSAAPAATGTILATIPQVTPQVLFADDAGHLYAYEREGDKAFVRRYVIATDTWDAKYQAPVMPDYHYFASGLAYDRASAALYFTPAYDPTSGQIKGHLATSATFDGSGAMKWADPTPIGPAGSTPNPMKPREPFTVDAAGYVWAAFSIPQGIVGLRKHAADGSVVKTVELPVSCQQLQADKLGNVWAQGSGRLFKVTPDGHLAFDIVFSSRDFTLDSQNRAWLPGSSGLLLVDNDGTVVNQFPIQSYKATWGDGAVWVTQNDAILKIAP